MAGFNPQNSAKIRFGGIDNRRLFTIYIWMGKPVGPRFRQMVRKIQDW